MSFWTALVVIVAILAYANLRNARYRQQTGQSLPGQSLPGRVESPASPALEREVIELRRRIEVLERIITDERGTQRLAQDIEALRE